MGIFVVLQLLGENFAHMISGNDLIPDSKVVDDSANFPNLELENELVIQSPRRESSYSSFSGNLSVMRGGEIT
jgi:hypothetical protein